MASASKRATVLAVGSFALSALAFYFGTGLHPVWWLTWLAPIPVLLFAFRSGALAGFVVAACAFLTGETNLLAYARILELPLAVIIPGLLIPPVVFGVALLLSRTAFLKSRYIASFLALPSVWVVFEFVSSFGPNGTALNLAYSQMNCLPLIQVASVTGIWGISFFVMFVASGASLFLSGVRSRSLVLAMAITIAVVFSFGVARLQRKATGQEVSLGLAALDDRPRMGKEKDAPELINSYAATVDSLASNGAKIIVLPEKIVTAEDHAAGPLFTAMREAAIRNSVTLVYGVDLSDRPLKHNLAVVLSPLGQIETVYEKHFHVPGWEDGYERGSAVTTLPSNPSLGVAICKDMDFPAFSRKYAGRAVELMLVPAWDFTVDDWLHGRMAVLRGVESGFAIARSAKQGLITVTDSRGRVLVEQHSSERQSGLVYRIRLIPHETTFYSRFGEWFAWVNLVVCVGLIVRLFGLNAAKLRPLHPRVC